MSDKHFRICKTTGYPKIIHAALTLGDQNFFSNHHENTLWIKTQTSIIFQHLVKNTFDLVVNNFETKQNSNLALYNISQGRLPSKFADGVHMVK